jgi:hypothetical protein
LSKEKSNHNPAGFCCSWVLVLFVFALLYWSRTVVWQHYAAVTLVQRPPMEVCTDHVLRIRFWHSRFHARGAANSLAAAAE